MTTHARRLPDLGANHEGRDAYLSVSTLTREARKLCVDLDIDVSGCRLRKLMRRFIAEGRSDIELRAWLLSYADPTGETAVRNVMRDEPR